jgi:hypothetical protein
LKHEVAVENGASFPCASINSALKGFVIAFVPQHKKFHERLPLQLDLDTKLDTKKALNVFKTDPNFEQSEAEWAAIRAELLGESSGDEEEGGEGEEESEEELDEEEGAPEPQEVWDSAIVYRSDYSVFVFFKHTMSVKGQSDFLSISGNRQMMRKTAARGRRTVRRNRMAKKLLRKPSRLSTLQE